MSNWSYQVLCDDDAMETFYELSNSPDLARDIELKLDKVKMSSDYRTSIEGLGRGGACGVLGDGCQRI